jgi:hypothetical protein
VQAGQQGPFVFVVKPDQTVELRNVVVTDGRGRHGDRGGLEPGETVVTDGHLRLVPGSKISVKGQDAREPRALETEGPMNLSSVFITRPVTTTLLIWPLLRTAGSGCGVCLPILDFPMLRPRCPEPARSRWPRRSRFRSRSSSPPFRV